MTSGLARSVLTRLVQHAKAIDVDPNLVLTRYVTERFLYRLSRSPHGDRFVLKGALLMLAWLGETIRPTRDADLLGFGNLDATSMRAIFVSFCTIEVDPDGVSFDPASIHMAPIRAEDAYGGQRVTLVSHLGTARIKVQVDVGIGDAVSPEPEWLDYPSLLEFARPRLRAYRPETAISEKVHAMVELGARNSRLRDFFDVHMLAAREPFEGQVLADALASTFARRGSSLPMELPLALTPEFAEIEGKQAQWRGFVKRVPSSSAPPDLQGAINGVAEFAGPVLLATARGDAFPARWSPGGPWRQDQ